MVKNKSNNSLNNKLLWIAAGIGFLGNLSANFIWYTSPEWLRFCIGLTGLIGFVILIVLLSKGYGKIE